MKINEILQDLSLIKDEKRKRIYLFNFVRDIPYFIGGIQDYDYILKEGHGDCKAKADLLAKLFNELGYPTRPVTVKYKLRKNPPEVKYIPDQIDYHHTLEVFIENKWVLTDPTYDPPLKSGGFIVNEWDGISDTDYCEKPLDIKRGENENKTFDHEFVLFLDKLNKTCKINGEKLREYTRKSNEIIKEIRLGLDK